MSVETDRAMRETALTVIERLARMTYQAGAIQFSLIDDDQLLFLPVAYLRTPHRDLIVGVTFGLGNPVIVRLDKMPTTIPPQHTVAILFPCGTPADMYTRYGFCHDLQGANRLARRMVKDGPMIAEILQKDPSRFVHEYTHYADMVRLLSKGISPQPTGWRTHGKVYYANTVMERNAYFIEAVLTVERHQPNWFSKPFPEFLDAVLSECMNAEYLDDLTEANRHRLINRFYQAWLDHQS